MDWIARIIDPCNHNERFQKVAHIVCIMLYPMRLNDCLRCIHKSTVSAWRLHDHYYSFYFDMKCNIEPKEIYFIFIC
jgi:hypothetical protein